VVPAPIKKVLVGDNPVLVGEGNQTREFFTLATPLEHEAQLREC
jgi:hypothetical protein